MRAIFSQKPRDIALSYLTELRNLISSEEYGIVDVIGAEMRNITDGIAQKLEKGEEEIENVYRFSWDFKPTKDSKLLLINEGDLEFDNIERARRQR